jgi:hypothetical protein
MNFRPELAEKVIAGEKIVTRRLVSDNPRSPWFQGRCALKEGKDYAVCPGRGKHAIGRVRIWNEPRLMRLGFLSDLGARSEGFDSADAFREAWEDINGSYDPDALVWRVEFRVAP